MFAVLLAAGSTLENHRVRAVAAAVGYGAAAVTAMGSRRRGARGGRGGSRGVAGVAGVTAAVIAALIPLLTTRYGRGPAGRFAAIALAPATRYGHLLYPLILFTWFRGTPDPTRFRSARLRITSLSDTLSLEDMRKRK